MTVVYRAGLYCKVVLQRLNLIAYFILEIRIALEGSHVVIHGSLCTRRARPLWYILCYVVFHRVVCYLGFVIWAVCYSDLKDLALTVRFYIAKW